MNIKPMYSNYNTSPFDRFDPLETYDHVIQGKMIVARYTQPEPIAMNATESAAFKEHLKQTLAIDLAKGMMHEGLISYTRMDDPNSFQTIYLARCFAVPDDKVQLLRTMGHK
jgi:hypothetical protein